MKMKMTACPIQPLGAYKLNGLIDGVWHKHVMMCRKSTMCQSDGNIYIIYNTTYKCACILICTFLYQLVSTLYSSIDQFLVVSITSVPPKRDFMRFHKKKRGVIYFSYIFVNSTPKCYNHIHYFVTRIFQISRLVF